MKRGRNNDWSAHVPPSSRKRLFKAELNGNGAIIKNEKDIEDLWKCGCFGKGLMSRSVPERYNNNGKPATKEKTSSENPFHGVGKMKSCFALLGVSNEPCQLTPQEVMYLVQEEKCLEIELDEMQLWSYYSKLHNRFALVYFVYHHYRKLGWIVRAGSKMGVDLVLYEDHPQSVHAKHSILIRDANDKQSVLSWPDLLGIGRVSENVRKTLIFCNVKLPDNTTTLENVINQSSSEELSYKRWATNRTRDAKDDGDWIDNSDD